MDQKIFARVVSQLEGIAGFDIDSVSISVPGKTFTHAFRSEQRLVDLRSISKVAVSLALGVALESGVQVRSEHLSLETRIWPFFTEYLNGLTQWGVELFREVELRHLLSNTIGHRDGFLFRKDIQGRDSEDLLSYIFENDLEFHPGSHFSYSNVGWYLFSAIVQNELGISLSSWVADVLLKKLGIHDFTWTQYGAFTAGATGLSLHNYDLHKIGLLLLSNGAYEGTQLVTRSWVETIRSPVVATEDLYDPDAPLPTRAYGYSIWSCGNGTYFCDGSGGQFLIVVPTRRTVISVLTVQGDTKPIARCLQDFRLVP